MHDATYVPGLMEHGWEVSQLGYGPGGPAPAPSPPHDWPGLPQTPGVPPPPQVEGALQAPQSSASPQPSERVPQEIPCCAHVVGTQACAVQTPLARQKPLQHSAPAEHGSPPGSQQAPPTQARVAGQVPHCTMPPQPLTARPHSTSSAAQVNSSHVEPPPQTPGVPPPPQVAGAAQVPHCRVPPQPSEAEPQEIPCASHVVGVQVVPGTHAPDEQTSDAGQSASVVQGSGQHVAV